MTTEPVIYWPLPGSRALELAYVACADPSYLETEEIRELAVCCLMQEARSTTQAIVADGPYKEGPDDDEDDDPDLTPPLDGGITTI